MRNESYFSHKKLELMQQLDVSVQTQHCRVRVDWFRAIADPTMHNRSWHAHSNPEVHFMLRGGLQYEMEEDRITLNAGQVLIIPSNMPHRLENPTPSGLLRFTLNVSIEPVGGDAEALFLRDALAVKKPVVFPLDGAVKTLLEDSLDEAVHRVSGFMIMLESNLLSLLILIARTLSNSPRATYRVRENQGMNKQRLYQILALMERGLSEPLTVHEIAAQVHLSTKQVQRIVQGEYGISVKQQMMRMRLQRAKELLKDAHQSIAGISAALGFASEQSFCRFFQKQEGCTPGKYRSDTLPPTY